MAHSKAQGLSQELKGLFCLYDVTIKNYRSVQAKIIPGGHIEASLTSIFLSNMEEERKSIKWLTLP